MKQHRERQALPGHVGMVIPAWFPESTPPEEAERLLHSTLRDAPLASDPGDVVVVADGSPVAQSAARALQERLPAEDPVSWHAPFRVVSLPENRGKGGALLAGLRFLLRRSESADTLAWVATRDADGDHLVEDLPHLVRAGEEAAHTRRNRPVCVIGSRSRIHAALGWTRGECELLVNEVLVDAAAFARARAGEAWDTRYLMARVPDLQSGYRLYNIPAAGIAARALEEAISGDPSLGRTAMEVAPFVALATRGALFGETMRKSFQDQPITTFGDVRIATFYGDPLAWSLGKCGIPPRAAAILLDGAIVRRPLFFDAAGRERLLELRQRTLDRLCGGPWPLDVPLAPRWPEMI